MPSRPSRVVVPALLAALGLSACMESPNHGETFSFTTLNHGMSFSGNYDKPNIQVDVLALNNPKLSPSVLSNWTIIGSTFTGTSPNYWNSSDPYYTWSSGGYIAPSAHPERWPQGGIARVRAIARDPDRPNYDLVTFDEDYYDCKIAHASESWEAIGNDCASDDTPYATIVSTTPTPADPQFTTPPPFLNLKGNAGSTTSAYYSTIGAPSTLSAFKTNYGFGLRGTDEATATYYNDGDLGIGREMHCKSFTLLLGQVGRACYVTNYAPRDAQGNVIFGDATNSLSLAVSRTSPIATVAMVYTPAGTTNNVRFMVYDANGNLTDQAPLDSKKVNTSVPNNCLTCHAGSSTYDTTTDPAHPRITGASFLPFDVFSFQYSTQAGFTYNDQADALRRLNWHVSNTSPASGIMDLINGLYAPNAVSDSAAVANNTYIPTGWNDTKAHQKLYNTVVKPYCRTCHLSQTGAMNWLNATDFYNSASIIGSDVCNSHRMPNSEHTQIKMWQSSARAHLTAQLGINDPCTPDVHF